MDPNRWNLERYVPVEERSRDALGSVWWVCDTDGAVSVDEAAYIAKVGDGSPEGAARVRREIDILQQLVGAEDERAGRSLPILIDANEEGDGEPWLLTMDRSGRTLLEEVERFGRVSERRVAEWMIDWLAALEHVHARNIVHGALTPASIWIDKIAEETLLLDFGSEPSHGDPTGPPPLIWADLDASTAMNEGYWRHFLSPSRRTAEGDAENEPAFPADDIYSVGAIGYYALTGAPTPVARLLSEAGVSIAFQQILSTLTDPSSAMRYPTAGRAREVVEAVFLQRVVRPELGFLGGDSPSRDHRSDTITLSRTQIDKDDDPEEAMTRRFLLYGLVVVAVFLGIYYFMETQKTPTVDSDSRTPSTVDAPAVAAMLEPAAEDRDAGWGR